MAGCSLTIPLFSQPSVDRVLHAATLRVPQFAYSGIAQGSLAIAQGSGLGPAVLQQVSTYPLQKTLAGTSVTITSGSVTVDGLMVYTLDRQIAFIVPSATPLGAAQLRITFNGKTSAPASMIVVRNNIGLYTWPQDGNGPAIVTDAISGALITVQSPAKPGQFITLWADGLGPVTSDETQPPTVADFGGDLTAWIGTQHAAITYRGRNPCCTGLDQINIRLPDDPAQGCYVPMYLKSDSAPYISNVTTLPITNDGKPCADVLGIPSLSVLDKDHVVTGLSLFERNFSRNSNGSTSTADFLHMIYVKTDQAYYNNAETQNHLGSVAPGTCIVDQIDNNSRYDPLNQTLLDAGPTITLTSGGTVFRFPHDDFGGYGAFIQGASPLDSSGAGSLSNGSGAQVPAFTLTFTTPALANFQWIEQSTLSTIQVAKPFTVTWTGSDPDGFVYIAGGSNNTTLNMTFTCRVSGAQSAFTVPSDITRFLPSGAGSLSVTYRRPVPVSGLPPGFDAMRYERQVVRSRPVVIE